MKEKEMWELYRTINPQAERYEAWAFGSTRRVANHLAALTLSGEKTTTAGAYDCYKAEEYPIPNVNDYVVVLNAREHAVCIIRITEVAIVPFSQVSEFHAYYEGEGNRSLKYWRKVHKRFFSAELKSIGLKFSEAMPVVCETFERVYPVTIR